MLRKKGISPLIATVLLVGFTIIIIALIIIWSLDFQGEIIEKEGKLSELKLRCQQFVEIDIPSTPTALGNELIIEIENTGIDEIKGFQFRIHRGGEAVLVKSFESITGGSIKQITLDLGTAPSNVDELDIIPALRPEGLNAPLVPCSNQHKALRVAFI